MQAVHSSAALSFSKMGVPAGPKLDFVGASEVCAQTTMLLIFVVARHIFVTQYKSISNDLR